MVLARTPPRRADLPRGRYPCGERCCVLLALALACIEKSFVPHCEGASTDLAWDEESALGFSAADALGTLRTAWSAQATTLVSTQTPLLAQVVAEGQVRFVDQWEAEVPDGYAVASIDVVCDDYLAVGVDLALETGDGQLDETWALDLEVGDPAGELPPELDDEGMPTEAGFSTRLDVDELQGQVDLDPYELDAYEDASISAFGRVRADGTTSGTVSLEREGQDGDTSYVLSDELAVWGD